jgi:hypothetical protein
VGPLEYENFLREFHAKFLEETASKELEALGKGLSVKFEEETADQMMVAEGKPECEDVNPWEWGYDNWAKIEEPGKGLTVVAHQAVLLAAVQVLTKGAEQIRVDITLDTLVDELLTFEEADHAGWLAYFEKCASRLREYLARAS